MARQKSETSFRSIFSAFASNKGGSAKEIFADFCQEHPETGADKLAYAASLISSIRKGETPRSQKPKVDKTYGLEGLSYHLVDGVFRADPKKLKHLKGFGIVENTMPEFNNGHTIGATESYPVKTFVGSIRVKNFGKFFNDCTSTFYGGAAKRVNNFKVLPRLVEGGEWYDLDDRFQEYTYGVRLPRGRKPGTLSTKGWVDPEKRIKESLDERNNRLEAYISRDHAKKAWLRKSEGFREETFIMEVTFGNQTFFKFTLREWAKLKGISIPEEKAA